MSGTMARRWHREGYCSRRRRMRREWGWLLVGCSAALWLCTPGVLADELPTPVASETASDLPPPAEPATEPATLDVPDPLPPGDAEPLVEPSDDEAPTVTVGDNAADVPTASAGDKPNNDTSEVIPVGVEIVSPAGENATAEEASTEPGQPRFLVHEPSPTEAGSSTESPSADAPAEMPAIPVESARFKGLQPGTSNAAEAALVLGKPLESRETDGQVESHYAVDPPFSRLAITFANGIVQAIGVELERAFPADELAEELALDTIRAADVLDDRGKLLGQAFPERGVLFSFSAGGKVNQVARLIIEVIDADPFVLRAETHWRNHLQASLSDVEQALRINAEHARAHWLRGMILAEVGRFHDARESTARAVALEPASPLFRLGEARVLEREGDYNSAAEHMRRLLDDPQLSQEWKAPTLLLFGNALALGEERDYKQALTHHLEAINLAKTLVDHQHVAVREAAQEVLFEAHLAVAADIAWGGWRSKDSVVPQWLDQAAALAEKYDRLPAHPWWRFRLAQAALATLVGMQGEQEATPWVEILDLQAKALLTDDADPLSRQAVEWELGLALYDALQIEHAAGRGETAAKYGRRAVELLERRAAAREPLEGQAYLLGRLYFRLGALEAAAKSHAAAVTWFDKAIPLIEEPIPLSAAADVGRQGESFVSMAISYWEAGKKDEAVRLTKQGATLMEQAVREGILPEDALTVPYQNLSSMHRTLGEEQTAKDFEQMAARLQKRR